MIGVLAVQSRSHNGRIGARACGTAKIIEVPLRRLLRHSRGSWACTPGRDYDAVAFAGALFPRMKAPVFFIRLSRIGEAP